MNTKFEVPKQTSTANQTSALPLVFLSALDLPVQIVMFTDMWSSCSFFFIVQRTIIQFGLIIHFISFYLFPTLRRDRNFSNEPHSFILYNWLIDLYIVKPNLQLKYAAHSIN